MSSPSIDPIFPIHDEEREIVFPKTSRFKKIAGGFLGVCTLPFYALAKAGSQLAKWRWKQQSQANSRIAAIDNMLAGKHREMQQLKLNALKQVKTPDTSSNRRVQRLIDKLKVEPPQEEIASHNQAVITLLRAALNSPQYRQERFKPRIEQSPDTQFLQDLCATLYQKTPGSSVYTECGQKLLETCQGEQAAPSQYPNTEAMVTSIESTFKKLDEDYGIQKVDGLGRWALFKRQISYGLRNLSRMQISLTSHMGVFQGMTRVHSFGEMRDYDSHLAVGNSPFVHSELAFNNTKNKVTHVFGGTPATNEGILPEFLGYLDWVKANQGVAGCPKTVLYFNLQEMGEDESRGETKRASDLMRLQREGSPYRTIFLPVTLAKDSPLYQSSAWPGAKAFTAQMRRALLTPENTQLGEQRKGTLTPNTGFYFPPELANDPAFQTAIETSLKETEKIFLKKPPPNNPQEAQQYVQAYQEMVYSLLQVYLKAKYAQKGDVVSFTICKEAMDRANTMIFKDSFLYDQANPQPQFSSAHITGIVFGRSLFLSQRNILRKRLEPILSFFKQVQVKEYLPAQKAVLGPLGLEVAAFNPNPQVGVS